MAVLLLIRYSNLFVQTAIRAAASASDAAADGCWRALCSFSYALTHSNTSEPAPPAPAVGSAAWQDVDAGALPAPGAGSWAEGDFNATSGCFSGARAAVRSLSLSGLGPGRYALYVRATDAQSGVTSPDVFVPGEELRWTVGKNSNRSWPLGLTAT